MSAKRIGPLAARRGGRLPGIAGMLLFLTVLSAVAWRAYQHLPAKGLPAAQAWALSDYHCVIYYPCRAVWDGVNPYEAVGGDPQGYLHRYPVRDLFPLYSPLILLLFAPLAMLPVEAGTIGFAALQAAMFVWLAYAALRVIARPPHAGNVWGLAALLLASQPGRAAFNSGQVAIFLALAAIGFLEWGDRHWRRSAALVAVSTAKPTFGGPIALLLVWRGDWRSALAGLAAGAAAFVLGVAGIFAHTDELSLSRLARVLSENQEQLSRDPDVVTASNKARIDLAASVEYLRAQPLPSGAGHLITVVCLAATAWAVWKSRRPERQQHAAGTASALILLAMLVCTYHNVYDALVLVVPLAACAVAANADWREMPPAWRWHIFALLLVPFINVLWTEGFGRLLGAAGISWGGSCSGVAGAIYRLACAANGLSLAAAWAMLLAWVVRGRARS